VTKTDLDYLQKEIQSRNYTSFDGTLKSGRIQFDTGAIFNEAKIRLRTNETLIDTYATRQLKVANQFEMQIFNDSIPIHIFVSHWPSPLTPESEELRIKSAGFLKGVIHNLTSSGKLGDRNTRVVLMGDFNEEPFQKSLEKSLLATRDRQLAFRRHSYLYNPFWRHIGEILPYHLRCSKSGRSNVAGTCYVPSLLSTNWKTVDQIIFSSAFIGHSDWHLNERLTRIVSIAGLKIRMLDHLPVIATIER